MERSTHPDLRKNYIDDRNRRFEELVERSEPLRRTSSRISSQLSRLITGSDGLISGFELLGAQKFKTTAVRVILQEIDQMPHDQEIDENSRQKEDLDRQIEETRLALENAERFREMLSPDNSKGQEYILCCLVELETRLASFTKRQIRISRSSQRLDLVSDEIEAGQGRAESL